MCALCDGYSRARASIVRPSPLLILPHAVTADARTADTAIRIYFSAAAAAAAAALLQRRECSIGIRVERREDENTRERKRDRTGDRYRSCTTIRRRVRNSLPYIGDESSRFFIFDFDISARIRREMQIAYLYTRRLLSPRQISLYVLYSLRLDRQPG